MRWLLPDDFDKCADIPSVLACVLDHSMEMTATHLGNVQLMNWRSGCLEIGAQRGFETEFLNFFRRVRLDHGTACGRVLRSRDTIVIDDVLTDVEFSPFRDLACRAGFRAVQSTPLVSRSGALVGVVSNHFSQVRRPSDMQLGGLKEAAGLAADAIIRILARGEDGRLQKSIELLERSYRAIDTADRLLSRPPHARPDQGRAAAE